MADHMSDADRRDPNNAKLQVRTLSAAASRASPSVSSDVVDPVSR